MRTTFATGLLVAAGVGGFGAAGGRAAAAAEEAGPSRRYVLRVAAALQAESYDLTFAHYRLAAEDGRDVLVRAPDGRPVSFLLASVDDTQCRVLFDGQAGPGAYTVEFGALATNLPPLPPGACAAGRKEWAPAGGFRSTAYHVGNVDIRRQIKDAASTLATVQALAETAAAAEKAEADKQADAAKRQVFIRHEVSRTLGVALPDRWVAIIRAEIEVAKAGEYEFSVDGAHGQFRVLFADGDHDRAVLPGWYGKEGSQHADQLSEWTGKATLSAGRHVLELYTSLSGAEIRWRPAGDNGQYVLITGREAYYAASKVKGGEIEATSGTLGDAVVQTVQDWVARGRFAAARQVCRIFRARLAGDAGERQRLAAAAEEAQAAAYQRDWLTESRDPGRRGAVPDAVFAPPFRMDRLYGSGLVQNRAGRSSAVWVEGALIQGLPWDVQDVPWGVTSAVCAGDDTLYASVKNGGMLAVAIGSGNTRWTFAGGGSCVGCPLLYRGVLYYGSLDRRLYALDAETGRMLWNYPVKGWVEGSPCADGGQVFFGARDGALYAVDAQLGVERWHAALGAPIVATPATDGKAVYVGTKGGDFVAVGAADGQVLWRYAAGAPILGGACLAAGRISFGDAAGKVHALATATGSLAWERPADVGDAVRAAPILVGHVLYGTAGRACWGVEAADGHLCWRMAEWDRDAVTAFARPPLYVDGKLIFIPEGLGHVYQFRMAPPPAAQGARR